jgi:hypothetical protein
MSKMQTSNGLGGTTHVARGSIAGRILQIRHMQEELRKQPVTGSRRWLKRLFYKAVHSAFARQFSVNAATLDLIETVYRDLDNRASDAATESRDSRGSVLASFGPTGGNADASEPSALHGFQSVYTSPGDLPMRERVTLYGLVYGMRPRNCLAVGASGCDAVAVICGALDDTGFGQLACVGEGLRFEETLWTRICNRCRVFEGVARNILPDVARQVGGPFDFVLLTPEAADIAGADVAGLLPHLADGACILVRGGMDDFVSEFDELTDGGIISDQSDVPGNSVDVRQGLRLLRFRRRAVKAKVA